MSTDSGRRAFLAGALAVPMAATVGGCAEKPRWEPAAYRKTARSPVAVLEADHYDGRLADLLLSGLRLFHLPIVGQTVVLKPNFVEYDPRGVINTHPVLIAAAIEAFRRAGARRVVIAEGPGHHRDTEHLLVASGLWNVLRDHRVPWIDLNTDEVRPLALQSRFTSLGRLYLPRTILDAGLLVSMPKLKTHHWAGVTLSMKNMFGVVPGAIYGWPKNVLHWAGIPESILDINSSLPVPRFAIVDGIVGMEGDGPIRGEPKPSGVLVLGADPVAVDATAARLMAIDPARVRYLAEAARFLGNLEEERIEQIGEPPAPHRKEFRLLPAFAGLRARTS